VPRDKRPNLLSEPTQFIGNLQRQTGLMCL
jgi:hypothetical protein